MSSQITVDARPAVDRRGAGSGWWRAGRFWPAGVTQVEVIDSERTELEAAITPDRAALAHRTVIGQRALRELIADERFEVQEVL
ncbi:MAG TPA: hypothetical protein VHO06_12575 [Polyangia bacterium]|nr:hypothetical protein [Polyangia bacterium]